MIQYVVIHEGPMGDLTILLATKHRQVAEDYVRDYVIAVNPRNMPDIFTRDGIVGGG